MRVLLDTNIIVDVAANRSPWAVDSVQILNQNAAKRLTACVTASTVTDLFYICRKLAGLKTALETVQLCVEHLEILNVSRTEIVQALNSSGTDFEDDLQIVCARINAITAIITRDKDGFKQSPIEVLTPAELLAKLSAEQQKQQ